MKLRKVTIIGKKYLHVFKNDLDGLVDEIETTKEDYQKLAYGGIPLAPHGFHWTHSIERMKVDTDSGDLEDGTYTENEDHTRIFAKLHKITETQYFDKKDVEEHTTKTILTVDAALLRKAQK